MQKRIQRFGIHATSKILALVAFVLSALVFIPLGLFGMILGEGESGFFFGVPIVYLVFTYLLTALYLWLYNLIAPHVGGISFEVTDEK